ncbi:hypothetical protein [Nostoc sp. CCY 9925]
MPSSKVENCTPELEASTLDLQHPSKKPETSLLKLKTWTSEPG